MPKPSSLIELLEGNRSWVERRAAEDADFFARHAQGQSPPFLFVGCSDSRVPPTNITGAGPGDLFVLRNIANLVRDDDLAAQSVLEFAIDVLEVEHVVVCGHTRCGGVTAALKRAPIEGAIGGWLAPIRALAESRRDELDAIADPEARIDHLVKLNVEAQVQRLEEHPVIQRARQRHEVHIHGTVYELLKGRVLRA